MIGEFGGNAELAVISLLGGASDESKQALENIQDNTPGESPDDGAEGRQEGIEELCRWQAVPVTWATNPLHLTIFSYIFWKTSSTQRDRLPPAAKRLSGKAGQRLWILHGIFQLEEPYSSGSSSESRYSVDRSEA